MQKWPLHLALQVKCTRGMGARDTKGRHQKRGAHALQRGWTAFHVRSSWHRGVQLLPSALASCYIKWHLQLGTWRSACLPDQPRATGPLEFKKPVFSAQTKLTGRVCGGIERATESRSLVQTIVFRKPLSKKVLLTQDFRKCSLRSHT